MTPTFDSPEQQARAWLTRVTDKLTCSRSAVLERLGYAISDIGLGALKVSPVVSRREASRLAAALFDIGHAVGIGHASGREIMWPTPAQPERPRLHVV